MKNKIILCFLLALLSLSVLGQDIQKLKYFQQTTPSRVDQIPYGANENTGYYVKSGDARIYYEIYGTGEPIVMLHGGIAGSTFEMTELIDRFSQNYQVIDISTRGHGKSELGREMHIYEQKVKDVIAVLDEVTKDSVTVFGSSNGGCTVYFLAGMFPERVKKMVILGAAETHIGDYQMNVKVSDMMALHRFTSLSDNLLYKYTK